MVKTTINLLPPEQGVKTDIRDLLGVLNKAAIFLVAVFIITAVSAVAYTLFLTNSVSRIRLRADQIGNSIKSMADVEAKYTLARDRLDKAKSFLGEKSAGTNLPIFSSLISSLPQGVVLSEASIGKEAIEVSFTAASSKDVSTIFGTFGGNSVFEKITLANFSFNPTLGYVVKLNIFPK